MCPRSSGTVTVPSLELIHPRKASAKSSWHQSSEATFLNNIRNGIKFALFLVVLECWSGFPEEQAIRHKCFSCFDVPFRSLVNNDLHNRCILIKEVFFGISKYSHDIIWDGKNDPRRTKSDACYGWAIIKNYSMRINQNSQLYSKTHVELASTSSWLRPSHFQTTAATPCMYHFSAGRTIHRERGVKPYHDPRYDWCVPIQSL